MIHRPSWHVLVSLSFALVMCSARVNSFLATSSARRRGKTTDFYLVPPSHQDVESTRRVFMQTFFFLPMLGATSPSPPADVEERIVVPLKWIPRLSAYVLYFSIAGDRFGAILDTGSPFLTIPSYCNEQAWGCYRPASSHPSGLPPTYERFDNNEGRVEWRQAPFSFVDASGSMMGPSEMTFGVLDEALLSGSGGVFFGLVRDTDKWIRPSFLSQTNVRAFEIDLASDRKTLTLTTSSLVPKSEDYVPLVTDLNRRYRAPTVHYTGRAKSVSANGSLIGDDGLPIYVIFDTGVTGMVVSRELFDQRYMTARQNRERTLWGKVTVTFQTQRRQSVSISAEKPVTTPLGSMPWPGFKNAHLVVVGLAFLDGHKMLVDMDQRRLQLL